MNIIEEIAHIDQELVKHSVVRYNYAVLNPINRKEEFKKFQEDKTYDPQFRYNSFDAAYHREELQQLDIPKDNPLSQLLEEVRGLLLKEAKALQNIGTDAFTVQGLFRPVSGQVLREARRVLCEPKPPKPKKSKNISAEQFAGMMEAELQKYNCRGWIIKFSPNAASRVSVSAGKKIITINNKELFNEHDVQKLLRHEIGTHVLRAQNGEMQDLKSCAIGLPHYLATEEGLAHHNEAHGENSAKYKLYYFARQALLTHYAANLGFSETYALVREYYPNDWLCFKSVTRAKRGMGDTARPGGYLKDHLYLQGKLLIDEYIKQGKDLRLLYAGKISVDQVHYVEEGLLKGPQVLPDFLEQN